MASFVDTLSVLIIALTAALVVRFAWKLFFDDELPLLKEILSFLVICLTPHLLGCHPPQKPAPSDQVIILADTTRVKLQHRADSSGKAVTIVHERTQQTLHSYEKAVVKFDSIRIPLP